MQQLQKEYRQALFKITTLPSTHRTKTQLLQTLISHLKQLHTTIAPKPYCENILKQRPNYQILSTTMSQCPSINQQNQKDIEQLQQKIIKMRMIKFQNNEDIQINQEQLFELQKIVKARSQFNDYMKRQIDLKMIKIQQQKQSQESKLKNNNKKEKDEGKSVLNKSLDAVSSVFKGKWWG